jgi:hypothetical protein
VYCNTCVDDEWARVGYSYRASSRLPVNTCVTLSTAQSTSHIDASPRFDHHSNRGQRRPCKSPLHSLAISVAPRKITIPLTTKLRYMHHHPPCPRMDAHCKHYDITGGRNPTQTLRSSHVNCKQTTTGTSNTPWMTVDRSQNVGGRAMRVPRWPCVKFRFING